jgi:hypothetical protein
MNSLKLTAIAAIAVTSLTAFAPIANADQKSKNNWRNLGVGAAAVGVYGALKGDKTLTAVGAAGAGYSAYRYEQDRKHQSQESSARKARRYHTSNSTRSGRKYYTYGGHEYYKNLSNGERVFVK